MADSKPRKSHDVSTDTSWGRRGVPLTPSSVMRVVMEVRVWWGRWGGYPRPLAACLYIPESKQNEIRHNFPREMDQKKQMIVYWINTDPLASWRRLITAIDKIGETELADSIRSNAEPLTDVSLTPHSLLHAVSTVRLFWDYGGLLEYLGVPYSVMDQIINSQSYSSEEEKRLAGLQYYLQTVPGVSWGRIASALWCMEEHTALDTVRQYLPHKHDVSFTFSNLTSALDSLPDTLWRRFGYWGDVPESTLRKIQSQFHTDRERKTAVLREYSTNHPQPTWEHVSDVLYKMREGEYHSVLDRLQSLFPTGRRRAKQIYEEEIKRGISKRKLTKVVMVGMAGSGKSTSLETIMEEKPPADRDSTPLLKRPVQTEVIYIDKSVKWVKKSPEEKKRYIANLLRARAQRLAQQSPTGNDSASTPTPVPPTSVQSTPDQPASSTSQSSTATQPATSPTPTSAATPAATAEGSSSTAPEVTIESLLQSLEVDDEFISLINVPSDSLETILEERVVYVTDSGGQPEFLEAMTVFLGETSACVLVIDLSQSLDEHTLIGYYRRSKPVSKPYRCIRSNEENLKQSIRTVNTFTSKTKGPPTKLLFLGTHRDILCATETVAEKNTRLLKIIPAKFKKQVISLDPKRLIFEINALNPDDIDKKTAEKVRSYILEQCPVKEVELPMRWHALEEKLRALTEGLGRLVMSRGECWQVAESLGLEKDSFDAALDFYHGVSLMFYFRDVLPGVVFIDPQVLLDKVSELIEFMFELREPEDQEDESSPDATAADNQPPSDDSKPAPHSTSADATLSHVCSTAVYPSSSETPKSTHTSLKLSPRAPWRAFKRAVSGLHPATSAAKIPQATTPVNEPLPSKLTDAAATIPSNEPLPRISLTSATAGVNLLPAGWEEFNKFGHITKSFLNNKRFNSHYHTGIFTSDDLIHLLEELLVFAKLSTDDDCPDTWFMPSVLKQVPAEKMEEVCVSPGPLLADFPDGGPQNGIFCSLMSHVLSPQNRHPHPWKLCLSFDEPKCLYRNCIQFKVPKYGTVTLIDRYEYFEVHVHTTKDKMQELWQHTRNALFSGIESVCGTLGYSNNKPRPAIICPKPHSEKSHAAYIEDGKWNCTCDDCEFGNLRDLETQFPWCTETSPEQESTASQSSTTCTSPATPSQPSTATQHSATLDINDGGQQTTHSLTAATSTEYTLDGGALVDQQQLTQSPTATTSAEPSTERTLDIDDLFEVQCELHDVVHRWKGLGKALRLRPPVLSRIEADRRDSESRLEEVLTEWLQQAYNTDRFGPPSWKQLVSAVAHPGGGNNPALAQQIAENHNDAHTTGTVNLPG